MCLFYFLTNICHLFFRRTLSIRARSASYRELRASNSSSSSCLLLYLHYTLISDTNKRKCELLLQDLDRSLSQNPRFFISIAKPQTAFPLNLFHLPSQSPKIPHFLLISTPPNPRFISSTLNVDSLLHLLPLLPPDVSPPCRKCSFSHLLAQTHPSFLGRSQSSCFFQKWRDFAGVAEAAELGILSDARSPRCEAAEDEDRRQVPVPVPVERERDCLAWRRFRMVNRKP